MPKLIFPYFPFTLPTMANCGLDCKNRKSRNTWGNRQIWPRSTEWSRAKANRVLPRECTGCSKHPLPTTPEKTLHMDITRWWTPKSDWLCSLQLKCVCVCVYIYIAYRSNILLYYSFNFYFYNLLFPFLKDFIFKWFIYFPIFTVFFTYIAFFHILNVLFLLV